MHTPDRRYKLFAFRQCGRGRVFCETVLWIKLRHALPGGTLLAMEGMLPLGNSPLSPVPYRDGGRLPGGAAGGYPPELSAATEDEGGCAAASAGRGEEGWAPVGPSAGPIVGEPGWCPLCWCTSSCSRSISCCAVGRSLGSRDMHWEIKSATSCRSKRRTITAGGHLVISLRGRHLLLPQRGSVWQYVRLACRGFLEAGAPGHTRAVCRQFDCSPVGTPRGRAASACRRAAAARPSQSPAATAKGSTHRVDTLG